MMQRLKPTPSAVLSLDYPLDSTRSNCSAVILVYYTAVREFSSLLIISKSYVLLVIIGSSRFARIERNEFHGVLDSSPSFPCFPSQSISAAITLSTESLSISQSMLSNLSASASRACCCASVKFIPIYRLLDASSAGVPSS